MKELFCFFQQIKDNSRDEWVLSNILLKLQKYWPKSLFSQRIKSLCESSTQTQQIKTPSKFSPQNQFYRFSIFSFNDFLMISNCSTEANRVPSECRSNLFHKLTLSLSLCWCENFWCFQSQTHRDWDLSRRPQKVTTERRHFHQGLGENPDKTGIRFSLLCEGEFSKLGFGWLEWETFLLKITCEEDCQI